MEDTLGLQLPSSWCMNHLEKSYVLWDKNIFCQCISMRSLRTEANHKGFTKPSSSLLSWCNI